MKVSEGVIVLVSSLMLLGSGCGYQLENGGKIWALLVAGSSGYDNYRHQADVCHAYQILHKNGIPDENIIVMMYDDIAYNEMNPTRGIIINQPNGSDVYKGVLKDYTGEAVNSTTFLKVLTGDAKGMRGIGSGRVIKRNIPCDPTVGTVGGKALYWVHAEATYQKLKLKTNRFQVRSDHWPAKQLIASDDQILLESSGQKLQP